MRKLVLLCFLIHTLGNAQHKQVLYEFADLPQTLLLNPGAIIGKKMHVGIPMLSGVHLQGGFSGFSTYDIFADNGVDINVKIREALNDFSKAEFALIHEQLE